MEGEILNAEPLSIDALATAALPRGDYAMFLHMVESRCGKDTCLHILHNSIELVTPAKYGELDGILRTELLIDDQKQMTFMVSFREYSIEEFSPVPDGYVISCLPSTLMLPDKILVLTSIHNQAELHLNRNDFRDIMLCMSRANSAFLESILPL